MRTAGKVAIAAGALIVVAALALPAVAPGLVLSGAMAIERGVAGLDEKIVQVDDHTIHYLEGGPADAPVLLLLHGFSGDKDNWTRFSRHLTDRYRVVAPDLAGWGQSSRVEIARYDLHAQAERVEAFRKQLSLPKVHVAGNSMGGNLTGVYALRFPEAVLSVGFFNNAGVPEINPSPLTEALARGEHPLIVSDAAGYRRLLELVFVEVPFVPEPVLAYFAERAVKNRAFTQKIWTDMQNKKALLLPRLGELEMCGDRSADVICPSHSARARFTSFSSSRMFPGQW